MSEALRIWRVTVDGVTTDLVLGTIRDVPHRHRSRVRAIGLEELSLVPLAPQAKMRAAGSVYSDRGLFLRRCARDLGVRHAAPSPAGARDDAGE